MMAFKKRSQAALEFLTTYGWAFLIILIMIGTLAYFGILNPSKLLPSRCSLGAEFTCTDWQISLNAGAADSYKMKIKSNLGEAISISAVTLLKDDGTPSGCALTTAMPIIMGIGEIKEMAFTCDGAALGWTANNKARISSSITYNTLSGGAGYARNVQGETYSQVLP